MRRKLLLEVVIKPSWRESGHVLLMIDRLLVSFELMCCVDLVMHFIGKGMNLHQTCNELGF
jgi:hypothetical protein